MKKGREEISETEEPGRWAAWPGRGMKSGQLLVTWRPGIGDTRGALTRSRWSHTVPTLSFFEICKLCCACQKKQRKHENDNYILRTFDPSPNRQKYCSKGQEVIEGPRGWKSHLIQETKCKGREYRITRWTQMIISAGTKLTLSR